MGFEVIFARLRVTWRPFRTTSPMIPCASPLSLLFGIIGNGPQGVVVTKPNGLLETRNHIHQNITPITQLKSPLRPQRCADFAVEGLIHLNQLARLFSFV
ncbi:hypothetical protein QQF64_003409 [Cirrhinus molitorella]|uniref:Uncharacterized protein n=1 Tax=Cirrhinus molitorella TaxID=172907 RepID=A0ABR3ML92_9TELE